MIDFVTIDNFATIRHISFDLGKGFNVITGETGAGKSVLVQAISTALGNRADISMIRRGTSKAVIQIAGEYNGEEVVIQRELLSSGKSHARINGSVVTLAQLREFCQGFAHIHGQYDNQPILNPENHTRQTGMVIKLLMNLSHSCPPCMTDGAKPKENTTGSLKKKRPVAARKTIISLNLITFHS